ncbi:MAG: uroporphyrinogen decarboxylase family protein [Planctomycetota bacterium]
MKTGMTKRDVVLNAVHFKQLPYVPWQMSFTYEASEKLKAYYKTDDLGPILQNHTLGLASGINTMTDIGNGCSRDGFSVVWDKSRDKDIGVVKGVVIPEPTLDGFELPDASNPKLYAHIPERIAQRPDLFREFSIGFSLFERAWTLRGMENLMMDFIEHPDFAHDLLNRIADFNIEQVKRALAFDIDCVHFGDDWGQQKGLIMGPRLWKKFIYPCLRRMYAVVKDAGKLVSIHSCGDVDELFDDLVGIGLNVFNPFQPEVMDVFALMKKYHGRLAFHGGLSTQKTLPYGNVEDVVRETRRLLDAGKNGGYIFVPAHSVEGDVPVENMVAFIDAVKSQPGFKTSSV